MYFWFHTRYFCLYYPEVLCLIFVSDHIRYIPPASFSYVVLKYFICPHAAIFSDIIPALLKSYFYVRHLNLEVLLLQTVTLHFFCNKKMPSPCASTWKPLASFKGYVKCKLTFSVTPIQVCSEIAGMKGQTYSVISLHVLEIMFFCIVLTGL